MVCPDKLGGICAHIEVLDLFGFPVCAGKPQEILDLIWKRMLAGQVTHIVTLNPEIVMQVQDQPDCKRYLSQADMFVADGQGICWAASKQGLGKLVRYPGIDLALDLLDRLAKAGKSVYFLGGEPGVAEQAAGKLKEDLPELTICGVADGYFDWSEAGSVAKKVRMGKPDLLLVGMGCPRQDRFIVEFREQLGATVMIGVGGALEVFAGMRSRAPLWMRRWGLEWVYRTLNNLSRLGRLMVLPRFVIRTLKERPGGLSD